MISREKIPIDLEFNNKPHLDAPNSVFTKF